jgi:hypothetical protein
MPGPQSPYTYGPESRDRGSLLGRIEGALAHTFGIQLHRPLLLTLIGAMLALGAGAVFLACR